MITVKIRDGNIIVSGHAGKAPKGQDIVCAAVSAITLTLINGLQNVAKSDFREEIRDGFVKIEWKYMNEIGKALIDTWYLGICEIAQEYIAYIQVV